MAGALLAAGGRTATLGQPVRAFLSWTDYDIHDPGIALSGIGTVDVVITAIDDLTGERTTVLDTVYSFCLPEVDDEVILSVGNTYTGDIFGAINQFVVGTFTDDFTLELAYTLTSADGGLVTLKNAVGFGFSEDSDGDGLYDDDEIALYGTDPLVADTDGDGVDDGDDPYPATPGVGSEWLAERTIALAADIESLDLSLVDAKTDAAASGRLGSLSTRAYNAADSFAEGRYSAATALLEGILDRVDGDRSPEDWLVDCAERTDIAETILILLELAGYA